MKCFGYFEKNTISPWDISHPSSSMTWCMYLRWLWKVNFLPCQRPDTWPLLCARETAWDNRPCRLTSFCKRKLCLHFCCPDLTSPSWCIPHHAECNYTGYRKPIEILKMESIGDSWNVPRIGIKTNLDIWGLYSVVFWISEVKYKIERNKFSRGPMSLIVHLYNLLQSIRNCKFHIEIKISTHTRDWSLTWPLCLHCRWSAYLLVWFHSSWAGDCQRSRSPWEDTGWDKPPCRGPVSAKMNCVAVSKLIYFS